MRVRIYNGMNGRRDECMDDDDVTEISKEQGRGSFNVVGRATHFDLVCFGNDAARRDPESY